VAYLRKEEDKIDVPYPLSKVWLAIPKTLDALEWTAEETDELSHRVRAKTEAGRGFWGSVGMVQIEVSSVGESATKVSILSGTVVTTITAIVDFGKARRMISMFLGELLKQLA
jgi:hypothetical protein